MNHTYLEDHYPTLRSSSHPLNFCIAICLHSALLPVSDRAVSLNPVLHFTMKQSIFVTETSKTTHEPPARSARYSSIIIKTPSHTVEQSII